MLNGWATIVEVGRLRVNLQSRYYLALRKAVTDSVVTSQARDWNVSSTFSWWFSCEAYLSLMRSDVIEQYCETSGWNWSEINCLRTGCGLADCDTTQTCGQPRTFRRSILLPYSGWWLHKIQNKNETYEVILTFYQLISCFPRALLQSITFISRLNALHYTKLRG